MAKTWQFHGAGEVIFGRGAVAKLGLVAKRLGVERALIVTDEAIVKAGLLARVIGPLAEAGVAVSVFDGGEPEPSLTVAQACVREAKKANAQALVSLGGGSNTDLAKAAAIILKHGGSLRSYFGEDKVPGPVLPIIAISTTAGTGSEVSGASILADKEQGVRAGILSNYLRPAVALYDPLMTVTCPPRVTADAGMDALAHAVEAYTCLDYQSLDTPDSQFSFYSGKFPAADCLALEAIRLVAKWLPLAVYEGANLEARENMHLASLLAGMAFSNAGVAVVHALEYPIGVMTHCTHGAGNGLLLPYVMAYNLPVRVRELRDIALAMGQVVDGLTDREAAETAVEAVQQLKQDVGLPMRLRDLGLKAEQLPEAARQAAGSARLMRINPRLPTAAELENVLREAY